MRAAGADGCRAGWICVTRTEGRVLDAFCAATAAELVGREPRPDELTIDVPIGLPDKGARRCDQEARGLLGPRRNSVFPAPLRGVVTATSWSEACEARRRIEGKGMSKQAWAIAPKIRELDELLRADETLRLWVREVHPELSFSAWNGRPMRHPKKHPAGLADRMRLVECYFGVSAFRNVRQGFRRHAVADDDILDAFAALWTGERILKGEARVTPADPSFDSEGLAMEIVF